MILLNVIVAGTMGFGLDFVQPAIRTEGGYTVITGEDEWSADSGAPSIPAYNRMILLPPGMIATGITAKGYGGDVIARGVKLLPSQSAVKIGDEGFIPESKEYYSQKGPLPGPLAELTGISYFAGQAVAMVRLYPIQYSPAEGTIRFYNRIEVDLETEPAGSRGISPKKATATGVGAMKGLAGELFVNPEAFVMTPLIAEGPLPPVDTKPSELATSVDYLLITDKALLPGFASLILYKNLMGIRTAVATTEWISAHYNGVDLPDKIRNFIKEAYREWGVVWVLLGGSTEHVPTRYVETGFSSEGESVVPCEWYYSCLDGNWNADGDAYYGECYTDSVDYLPEVFVGRAYARNMKEAQLFSMTFFQYQFRPGPKINRAIFIGPQLWPNSPQDGELVCEAIQAKFPACIDTIEFYERFHNIYLDTIIHELYRGTGFWVSVSHGSYDLLHIGAGITIDLVDTLSNWDYMPVASVISCLVGAFDKGALMTHFATAPRGGFIASKAVSRNGYVSCQDFDSTFYRSLFTSPSIGIGGHDAESRIPKAPGAHYISLTRYLYLSYTLLGDPGLFPWICFIPNLTVSAPSNLNVGRQSFTINVKDPYGDNVPDANVVIYKQNEIYEIRQTNSSGDAQFNVIIPSSGPLLLGVHKVGFVPVVETLNVNATGPWLTVTSASARDFDRDGYAEAGETLNLSYAVKNGGSTTATGVVAKISTASPLVTVIDSQMTLPPMAPNSTLRTVGFTMRVASPLPDSQGHVVVNLVFLKGPDTVGIDTVGFDVYAPVLRKWVRQLDVDSLSLLARFKPGIANRGWADAKGLTLTLTSSSPGITIIDGTAQVSKINKRAYLEPWNSTDGFTFRLSGMNALDGAELSVIISNSYGPLDTLHYIIRRNIPSTGRLWGIPDSAAISLCWEPPYGENPYGYLVYRADNILGPYSLVSYEPPSVASFTDYTVQQYRLYYYKVCAVDSFYNPGQLSEPVMLATYLKRESPWPIMIQGAYQSSPVMCDLDPAYPGNEIVLAITDHYQTGDAFVMIHAFHYDGTNVDGWPVIVGDTGGWVRNELAVGDIDGNGSLEVVFRIFNDDHIFVLRNNGTMMPGWPKWIGWIIDFTQTPTLADLDGDGKLEILASQGDVIYAFRYDGTGFLEPSGLFFRHPLGSGEFGSPSVADVDQDGRLEIVAGFQKPANSEIWVLKTDGTVLSGFPCFTSRGTLGPAIAVGDLITNILGDEMVVLASNGGSMKSVFCVGSNGQILWTKDAPYGLEYAAVPSLGDVDNDGAPEALVVGERKLLVYDADGTPLPAYSTTLKSAHHTSVTSADVDGDGKVEYFVGDYGGFLYGLREGGYVEGFPIPLGLYNIAVPQIGEFDNDGRAEIVQLNANNYLYLFGFYKGPPKWSNLDWRTYKHDNWRTGWLGADSIIAKQEAQWNIASTGTEPPVISWGPTITRGGGSVALNLKTESMVRFRIYDPSGRMVEEPCSGTLSAGFHWISWGKGLPSGVYFLRLELNDQTHATKSLIIR